MAKEIIERKDFNFEQNSFSLRDIFDMIETIDTVPTSNPTSFFNQFKIYKNGATKRFYWYDNVNGEWSYVAGT